MRHWLMKTEPETFSIADLARKQVAPWDGVRNYQARNFMREMKLGDRVFIYHSNANPSGIAGLAEVARIAYPDHTAWDPKSDHFDAASTPEKPRWSMVDVRYRATFARFLPLDELRAIPELAGMVLFQRSRLSVQPIADEHARFILALSTGKNGPNRRSRSKA
jgi:predicted RNA-binding protein with PUA-like domain